MFTLEDSSRFKNSYATVRDSHIEELKEKYRPLFALLKTTAEKMEPIFDDAGILKILWCIETAPTVTPDALRRIKSAYLDANSGKPEAIERLIEIVRQFQAQFNDLCAKTSAITYCDYGYINQEKFYKTVEKELAESLTKCTTGPLFEQAKILSDIYQSISEYYEHCFKEELDDEIYSIECDIEDYSPEEAYGEYLYEQSHG